MPGSTSETINVGATITPSAGTAKVLPKIDSSKPYSGEYLLNDADNKQYDLFISNTFKAGSNLRNYVRLKHVTPATPTTSEIVSTVTVSIDGLASQNADLDSMIQGICGWLASATVAKLRGGQS